MEEQRGPCVKVLDCSYVHPTSVNCCEVCWAVSNGVRTFSFPRTDNETHFVSTPTGEDEIPEMPVERDLIDRLKARVELARQVDRMQHGVAKEKHDKKWLKDTAEAMEIELDDDMLRCVYGGSLTGLC